MFFKPKTAPKDFQKSMLPQNRRQVFADVIKLHGGKLLLLGLLSFVFALPIHIVALTQDLYAMQLPLENAGDALADVLGQWIGNSNMSALIQIPCLAVFAVGFSGLLRVIRQLAWEENMYFRYDFLTGIRQNLTQTVLLAVLAGILRFVCNYIYNLSLLLPGEEVFSWLGVIPTILFSVLCIPPAAYATVCIALYGNSFRQNLKLGFLLYARHPWKSVLAVVCGMIVFLPQYLSNFYCIVIGRIVGSILIPFILLGFMLFSFNALDERINPEFHPELVGKGAFPNIQ